ncbi:MAG TPA: zf-HC2 domain-containing protein [Mycobacterium sp.]|nr:zf-HC2 domain-containing protein [Mycobacterium sp.]HPZ95384.1 zf-HC2 domain-containing protein [Mycobacterium sp.]HQE13899.1 zf-HC2 domain-containing protein [Mycobacterium sp.]
MDCDTAREALSARIDGEREPIPAARVDEHLTGCAGCRDWYAAAVEQTQLIRRLAGRSQVSAVRPLSPEPPRAASRVSRTFPWTRCALGVVGVIQVLLAIAQGLGVHLGVPHAAMGGHVLNESTAWSAALGVAMVAAAFRPAVAGGLTWVLAAFSVVLSGYVITDALAGRVTLDRALTHLPVLAGVALAWLVWRQAGLGGRSPDRGAVTESEEIVLPRNASPGRRRSHLRPSDGSAA